MDVKHKKESWRSTGVEHKKNEVFVDVVETVNACMNAKGEHAHTQSLLVGFRMLCVQVEFYEPKWMATSS